MFDFVILSFFGFIGGVLSGLFGIGGGVIFTFVLLHILPNYGISSESLPAAIIANSLACVLFTTTAANIKNVTSKVFPWKMIIVTSIPATGILILSYYELVRQPWFSIELLQATILVLMLFMLFKEYIFQNASKQVRSIISWPKQLVTGLAGGFVAAFSGFGGGVVMVPIMNSFFGLSFKTAKYISLGVIMFMVFILTAMNSFLADSPLVWHCILGISFGSIIGAPLAIRLIDKYDTRYNKRIFMLFMTIFISWKSIELAYGVFITS